MIRGFIGSDADRIGPPEEAIRIRAIGSDPRLIADQSDPLGALVGNKFHSQVVNILATCFIPFSELPPTMLQAVVDGCIYPTVDECLFKTSKKTGIDWVWPIRVPIPEE